MGRKGIPFFLIRMSVSHSLRGFIVSCVFFKCFYIHNIPMYFKVKLRIYYVCLVQI